MLLNLFTARHKHTVKSITYSNENFSGFFIRNELLNAFYWAILIKSFLKTKLILIYQNNFFIHQKDSS